MRMTEQELEAYIRQYTELEKECMKSRFPEKFSNEEFWNQRSREKDGYILETVYETGGQDCCCQTGSL